MNIESQVRKLQEKMAELINPGFSYYEQELIRRVFKSIIKQLDSKGDISTAKEILKRTEWLDSGR